MRNTSFFEKLTGSLRLTDDDLKALNEHADGSSETVSPATTPKVTLPSAYDDNTIIEETDEDFEIPDDAEVETVEEVIEDDSIDSEEIEEYYEEIIDEEEPARHMKLVDFEDEPQIRNTEQEIEEEDVEETDDDEDYPVFNIEHEEEPEEAPQKILDYDSRAIEKSPRPQRPTLPIDMYELHHEIIIRTLVPGITPENLKVSITRDHVSISGTRPAPDGVPSKNYFEREVEWGEFSRMIELPTEVDVEHAEAVEKYGLLVIRLPKIDSMKTQELKVKSV
ncbi:MAG TPA: Hsp20/alpha crystallin family protein [Candidatus Paceibacterota bacterium]|nr:Hsp20/alpha crystallin family protein [Candidatus Paceibacterota bacterium]